MVPLAELATLNPSKPRSLASRRDRVAFLPMSDVGEDGSYRVRETRPVPALVRGYTYFARGDLLLAKITPCMENGKATDLRELPTDIGFGSTEFHVVRPGPRIDARYLFHLLWSRSFRRAAAQHMRGSAGQRRVPIEFLARAPVPLVPLAEQRRIAAILDTADRLRRKRRRARELREALLRACFVELFGDLVHNPTRWPLVPLTELCTGKLRNGLSPSRAGRYPGKVLTLAAITRGSFDPSAHKRAMFELDMPATRRVRAQDLLVCRGNGNLSLVGCARFVTHDAPELLFPDTMIGVPIDASKLAPAYVEQLWNSPAVRRQLERRARTTNGTHKINHKLLRALELPVPPYPLQQRFATLAAVARRDRARAALAETEALFESLVEHRGLALGPTTMSG